MTADSSAAPVDPLLVDEEGYTALLLGNEAIVRGALEAGVFFACGYPGTPSSEVTDSFARLAPHRGLVFEYSVNEKVALEMAFAASLAGARSIVAMKHLGLMYAGDPLSTIPYIGTVGGMVIVSAGDPSCMTSPNEQDQRQLAPMLHVPMLDPGDPQEALEMTRLAFELSEQSQLPVILRPTTQACHTRAVVTYGRLQQPVVRGFTRDPRRFVPIPNNARVLRGEIKQRVETARQQIDAAGLARRSGPASNNIGNMILAAGVPAATCSEVLQQAGAADDVVLLRLGAVFPLPEDWLVAQLKTADTLLVVEELSPYLEDAVRALCSLHDLRPKILGKRTGHLPTEFEYRPEIIQRAVHEVFQLGTAPEPATEFKPPPGRPPVLCAACPHRSAFYAVRAAFSEDTLFFNDIGCYTLGYGPPLETADALLCMGAGFTLAAGVSRTTGERTVGFMGDSTFFHSGMPALLDAIKANTNMVAVIMDNEVTAMTGFQESPSAAVEQGRIQQRVDIAGVVRALGAEHVETVDPEDLATTIEAFRRARDRDDLSVIITRRPCPVFARREGVAAGAEVPQIRTYRIDHDRCRHCGRESCGQRCSQGVVMGFERAMARARSLEPAAPGVEKAPPAVAPCASKCPLYLCIQGYAAHIAAGQYADALELIVSGLPLPESVCRVCHKPCETACVRGGLDQPVAINDLKRFVMDWAREQGDHPYRPKAEADNGMHVAVVGAGPSGLSAAHELRLRGYAVTLLDANSEAGGLLLTGIPRYRLPLAALRRDVQRILDTGVEFVGNRRLGDNLRLDRLLAEHDAVYLAVGAGNSLELGLEGNGNGPPVIDAVGYLRGDGDAAAGNGKRVVVIGGGNAAIDAARSLLRDGARQVAVACLEGRQEMPAIQSEIREAEREGIQIHAGVKAMRLLPAGVEVLQVTPHGPAPRSPDDYAPVADTEMLLAADLLVTAIGQVPDRTTLGDDGPELSLQDGRLVVDPQNGQTSHPRVFAGGDLAFGVQTVTDAIAHGLRAAWGMDRELRSAEHADRRMPPPLVTAEPAVTRPGVLRADPTVREHPAELDPDVRARNFDEVVGTLSETQARAEAARCMICGQCGNCRACLDLFGCPAFYVAGERIEIDADLCVVCGVCAELCPNGAIVPVPADSIQEGRA